MYRCRGAPMCAPWGVGQTHWSASTLIYNVLKANWYNLPFEKGESWRGD
jgi:hypothetical protein